MFNVITTTISDKMSQKFVLLGFLAISLIIGISLAEYDRTGFKLDTVKGYLEEGIGDPDQICQRYSVRKYKDCKECCGAMYYERSDESSGKCICIQNEFTEEPKVRKQPLWYVEDGRTYMY